jgi:hypothetical protein
MLKSNITFNENNDKQQISINDALIYWDPIQETFLSIISAKELSHKKATEHFNINSDTFVDFLEQLSEKYDWFDYRMSPHIIEFITVLIEDTFCETSEDTEDQYNCWYIDLEQNIRNTYNIELVDLLERVRYRINVEHFFERQKTPDQTVYLIGSYYLEEIEELQKK